MKRNTLHRMTCAAVLAALTFAATTAVHIPMPATGGFLNLGDCMVLLSAFLMGPVWGAAAGGIGSMMADVMLGYSAYAPATLLIKGLMAVAAALLFRGLRKRTGDLTASLVGGIAAEVIMVGGYFAYEAWLLGYGLAAAASVPGNAAQGVAGLVVGVLLCQTLYHIPVVKRTVQMF